MFYVLMQAVNKNHIWSGQTGVLMCSHFSFVKNRLFFPPRIPIEKAACFAHYFALVMCAEGENKDGADV